MRSYPYRQQNERFAIAIVLAITIAGMSRSAEAQVEIEPDQQYLLLATTRTGTMQEELDEAASLGFRVVSGAPTSGEEMVIFLRRTESTELYTYRLLATSRTSTMQEELEEAATEGYRFLPRTPLCKSRRFGGDEIVSVLERDPNGTTRYEYLLLATSRTSTLQAEVTDAVSEGFEISALVSCNEHMAILERSVP